MRWSKHGGFCQSPTLSDATAAILMAQPQQCMLWGIPHKLRECAERMTEALRVPLGRHAVASHGIYPHGSSTSSFWFLDAPVPNPDLSSSRSSSGYALVEALRAPPEHHAARSRWRPLYMILHLLAALVLGHSVAAQGMRWLKHCGSRRTTTLSNAPGGPST